MTHRLGLLACKRWDQYVVKFTIGATTLKDCCVHHIIQVCAPLQEVYIITLETTYKITTLYCLLVRLKKEKNKKKQQKNPQKNKKKPVLFLKMAR